MDREREIELVHEARTGSEDAFRELVEANHRKVYSLALRYTGRHEDADEIAQETFIRAYRGLRSFRGDARFGTWIFRIGVNCCFSHAREQQRKPVAADDEELDRVADNHSPSPLRQAASSQTRGKINEALDSLSEQQRMIFVMKFLQHKKIGEIAQSLGCAEGTVKKQLFRAVGRMRDNLAPLLGAQGLEG